MKKLVYLLVFTFISIASYAQNAVVEGNGKVVVRKDNGTLISTVESSGAVDAAINSSGTEVVVTYENGRVVVRKSNGTLISTVESSKARSARWSGNDIVVTYRDGKVQKRKKNGTLITTISN
jgi:hypothetical protein